MNVCRTGREKTHQELEGGGDNGDASGWGSAVGKEAFPPIPPAEQTHLENE